MQSVDNGINLGNMKSTCSKTRPFLYQPLVVKLKQRLADGALAPGAFVASESTLAQNEGVSRTSVRRAVEVFIRDGTLERRPGKGLFVRESHVASRTIHIVVPNLSFHLCVEVARGVRNVGLATGVKTLIDDAHGNLETSLQALRHLPETAADGAVIWSWHHPRFTEVLYELKAAGYPFVLVDEIPAGLEIPCVAADNYQGGYTVGQVLLGRGHRRIAFVGFLNADSVSLRLEGLRDAISDAGLPFDRSLVGEIRVEFAQDWSAEIGRVVRALMERSERPTAIFFCNDYAAAIGCTVLRDLGLLIGGDIAVVGFDGDPVCELLSPRLATIRQPGRQMGEVAMRLLGQVMAGALRKPGGSRKAVDMKSLRQVLPVDWVEGGSVGSAIVGTAVENGPLSDSSGRGQPRRERIVSAVAL